MAIFKEFPDKQSLIKDLTKDVSQVLSQGILKNQKASIVVSGGSTPKPFFQELQKSPFRRRRSAHMFVETSREPTGLR